MGGARQPSPGEGREGATPHTAARLARGDMRRARWLPLGGGTDGMWGRGRTAQGAQWLAGGAED